MGAILKLKPVAPRVNRNHPLARGLGLFLLMDEFGPVLRNLAPRLGTREPHENDVLIPDNTIQRIAKDSGTLPGNALECLNPTSNFNKGTFRGGALVDTGAVHTVDFQIQRRNVTNGYGTILAENAGDGIYLRSNTFCKPTVYFTGDHNATTDLTNNDDRLWHHYVIVNDTGNSRGEFYLNGVADGTYSPTGFTAWTPDSMFNDSSGERLQAWLNFVRLWYRALTPGEAIQLAADPWCMLETPRKWWMMLSSGLPQRAIRETAYSTERVAYSLADTFSATARDTAAATDRPLYDLVDTMTAVVRETGSALDRIIASNVTAIGATVREAAEGTDGNTTDRSRVSADAQATSGPAMAILTHIYDYFGPGLDWAFSDVSRTAPAHGHAGRVISWGTSVREIPIPAGGPRLGRLTIEFDDAKDPITGVQFFRSQFGDKTPEGKRVDLKIGPADGKESLFLTPAAGVIEHATFPPGRMRLEVPDVRYNWLQKPMPGLINDRNFPDLPPGVKEVFAPWVLGTVSSVGFGEQGAIRLTHVDTAFHHYLVARHPVESVTVYRKTFDEAEFTEVVSGWSLIHAEITIDGLDYVFAYVEFGSDQAGAEIRADVVGLPDFPIWGTVSPVTGGSDNVIDHAMAILYYVDALEAGFLRTMDVAFETYDLPSFATVRQQFEDAGYLAAYAITEPLTPEEILTQMFSTFMIHWFPNRFDKTRVVMTTAEPPADAPIFGDFHSMLAMSETVELARETRNRINYKFGKLYSDGQWAGSEVYNNEADQALLVNSQGKPIIKSEDVEFHACRDADVALLLAIEWSVWRDQDAHRIRFSLDLPTKLTGADLAKDFLLTHYGGLKEGGWIRERFIPYRIEDQYEPLRIVVDAIRRAAPPVILPQANPQGEWRKNSRVGPWYNTGNKTLFACFADSDAELKKLVIIANVNE